MIHFLDNQARNATTVIMVHTLGLPTKAARKAFVGATGARKEAAG